MDHLLDALRMAPRNATYLSYFGFCLAFARGHYLRAIRHCRDAVAVNPREVMHHVNLGRVYQLKGDREAAYETLQRAFRIKKNHPAVAAELARMGIRRPPFFTFLGRDNPINRCLGVLRAHLERSLIGHRQS
jgi:Flp pilus assembly protein TadD